jgi:hypothetical protein
MNKTKKKLKRTALDIVVMRGHIHLYAFFIQGISLKPGDRIELGDYFTTNEAPARFQYAFEG